MGYLLLVGKLEMALVRRSRRCVGMAARFGAGLAAGAAVLALSGLALLATFVLAPPLRILRA
jgi:hypothetical protein